MNSPEQESTSVHLLADRSSDWVNQRGLAAVLGIFEHTASVWARAGRLRRYEHGVANCGRRRYSRQLVEIERRRCWEKAVRAQGEQG